MKNNKLVLTWQTGVPTKTGVYLTTRLSKLPSHMIYTSINLWDTTKQKWEMQTLDNSEVIAWIYIDKGIQPYKPM